MAGFDKYLLEQKLIKIGWIRREDNTVAPSKILTERMCAMIRSKAFSEYDARDLHTLLFPHKIDYLYDEEG